MIGCGCASPGAPERVAPVRRARDHLERGRARRLQLVGHVRVPEVDLGERARVRPARAVVEDNCAARYRPRPLLPYPDLHMSTPATYRGLPRGRAPGEQGSLRACGEGRSDGRARAVRGCRSPGRARLQRITDPICQKQAIPGNRDPKRYAQTTPRSATSSALQIATVKRTSATTCTHP